MIPHLERHFERQGRPAHLAGKPLVSMSDAELMMADWRICSTLLAMPREYRLDADCMRLVGAIALEREERGV